MNTKLQQYFDKNTPLEIGLGSRTMQIFDGFYTTGMQYLELGFKAESEKKLICANLWHLGIEMVLKVGISKQYKVVTLDDADKMLYGIKYVYRHGLQDLWTDIKECYPDQDLDVFDDTIAMLEPWTDLKYPKLQEQQIVITRDGKEVMFLVETNFQIDQPLQQYRIDAKKVEDLKSKLQSILGPYSKY